MDKKKLFNIVGFVLFLILLSIYFLAEPAPGDKEIKNVKYVDLRGAVHNPNVLISAWGEPESENYSGNFCITSRSCLKYTWNENHFAVYDKDKVLNYILDENSDTRYFHKFLLRDMGLDPSKPSHERNTLYQFDYVLDKYSVSVHDKDTSALIQVEYKKNF